MKYRIDIVAVNTAGGAGGRRMFASYYYGEPVTTFTTLAQMVGFWESILNTKGIHEIYCSMLLPGETYYSIEGTDSIGSLPVWTVVPCGS